MKYLKLLSPTRWLIIGLLITTLITGYFSWRGHEREIGAEPYKELIKANNKAAEEKYIALEAKSNQTTQELKDFKKVQEATDATNEQTIAILAKHSVSRMRDPNQARCSSGSAQSTDSASTGDSPKDPPETGGLLSEELTGLLNQRAFEADQINNAYISCRADIFNLRTKL